jgi:hypothetical protein
MVAVSILAVALGCAWSFFTGDALGAWLVVVGVISMAYVLMSKEA